jgi:hypothetical protein
MLTARPPLPMDFATAVTRPQTGFQQPTPERLWLAAGADRREFTAAHRFEKSAVFPRR